MKNERIAWKMIEVDYACAEEVVAVGEDVYEGGIAGKGRHLALERVSDEMKMQHGVMEMKR